MKTTAHNRLHSVIAACAAAMLFCATASAAIHLDAATVGGASDGSSLRGGGNTGAPKALVVMVDGLRADVVVNGEMLRVRALMELLRGTETVTLRAMDSRESYAQNKIYYQQRLEEERNPAIRELLLRDKAYLDEIQTMTASAREFALVYVLERQGNESVEAQLTRMAKDIRDRGFHVRLARDQDLKRLLAVYYQQDVTTEYFESVNGESVVRDDAENDE